MKKELIVSHEDDLTKIALLEDGRLCELHEQEDKSDFIVGDLFIGKVKKLAPNLNAAFVNIGYEKMLSALSGSGTTISYLQKVLKDTISKKQNSSSLKISRYNPK
jgi:ribonuclease G